jgi:hypothetical protein
MVEKDELRDAEGILRKLSTRSEVADDLPSRATVRNDHSEVVDATVTERVKIRDKVRHREQPVHRYEEIEERGVPMSERFDDPPSGYADHTVEFYDPDYSAETCSKCDGNTQTPCANCGGDGDLTCEECAGEKRVQCESCGGDGEFECTACSDGTESCSNCRGSGSLDVYEERQCGRCAGATRHKCPDCAGTGENADGDECRTCRGEKLVDCDECTGGTVEEKVGTKDCGRCGGSGSVDCSNCGGSEIDRQCGECSGRGTVRCSNCGGTGTVECSTCRGSGKVDCSRCGASGEVVTAEHGTVSYDAQEVTDFDTGELFTSYLRSGDVDRFGTHHGDTVTVDGAIPDKGKKDTFRERRREYTLPAKRVHYRYEGEFYNAVQIGDDVRADEYPRSAEHLAEQIDEAKADGRFTLGGGATFAGGIKLGAIEVGFAVAAAVLGTLAVLIGTVATGVLGWALGLGGTTRDAVVVGLLLLVMVLAGAVRFTSATTDGSGGTTTFNSAHLLLPFFGVGGAFLAVESGVLGAQTGFLAFAVAVALWAGMTARGALFERKNRQYADEQASTLLNELGIDWGTLERHGLVDEMPVGPDGVDTGRQLLCARAAYGVVWPAAAAMLSLAVFVLAFGFPPGVSLDTVIAVDAAVFGAGAVVFGAASL